MRTLKDVVTIGSWVKLKGSEIYTILTESAFDDGYIDFAYEGIVIEDDIFFLETFGFTKQKDCWFYEKEYSEKKDTFKIAFHEDSFTWFVVNHDFELNFDSFLYIHDLQRNFKKVTGTELKSNLKNRWNDK